MYPLSLSRYICHPIHPPPRAPFFFVRLSPLLSLPPLTLSTATKGRLDEGKSGRALALRPISPRRFINARVRDTRDDKTRRRGRSSVDALAD